MKYFVEAGEDRRLDTASRQALRGSFLALADGVTHYELSGPEHGELVVLVPGITIPLFYWDVLASQLHARGLRTLAYSAYGRGYSDRVQAVYDEALFVRQLAELPVALGLTGPYHLVGTSMGTLIAMAYATQRRASVSTLSIVGPAGLGEQPAPQRLLRNGLLAGVVARWFGRKLLERHVGHNVRDPELADRLAEMVRDACRYEGSLYAFFATLQSFPLYNRAELFRRAGALGIPTLLAWGADDNVTPITAFGTARDLLRPRATRILDCGHMAPLERPQEVADTFARFAMPQQDWSGS